MAKKEIKKAKRSAPKLATAKKKELFLKAMLKNNCNISKSCEAVKISRALYYDWCDKDDKFYEAAGDVHEALADMIEGNLVDMAKYNVTAAIFWLKNKSDRGYEDEQKITINQTPQSIIFTPFEEIQQIDETEEKKGLTE